MQDWWDSARVVTESLLRQVEDQARRVQVHSTPPPAVGSGSHPHAPRDAQRLTPEGADALLRHSVNVTVWVKAVYASDDADQMGWPQDGWISNLGQHRPHIADGDLLVLFVDAVHDPDRVAASSNAADGQ